MRGMMRNRPDHESQPRLHQVPLVRCHTMAMHSVSVMPWPRDMAQRIPRPVAITAKRSGGDVRKAWTVSASVGATKTPRSSARGKKTIAPMQKAMKAIGQKRYKRRTGDNGDGEAVDAILCFVVSGLERLFLGCDNNEFGEQYNLAREEEAV